MRGLRRPLPPKLVKPCHPQQRTTFALVLQAGTSPLLTLPSTFPLLVRTSIPRSFTKP